MKEKLLEILENLRNRNDVSYSDLVLLNSSSFASTESRDYQRARFGDNDCMVRISFNTVNGPIQDLYSEADAIKSVYEGQVRSLLDDPMAISAEFAIPNHGRVKIEKVFPLNDATEAM